MLSGTVSPLAPFLMCKGLHINDESGQHFHQRPKETTVKVQTSHKVLVCGHARGPSMDSGAPAFKRARPRWQPQGAPQRVLLQRRLWAESTLFLVIVTTVCSRNDIYFVLLSPLLKVFIFTNVYALLPTLLGQGTFDVYLAWSSANRKPRNSSSVCAVRHLLGGEPEEYPGPRQARGREGLE